MSDGRGIMFGSRGVLGDSNRGSHQEVSKRKSVSDCVVWRRRGLARTGVKRDGLGGRGNGGFPARGLDRRAPLGRSG